jgi:hypothetical protein
MTALRAVFGKEVEVIARDVEGARKLWSPESHEGSIDIRKIEFRLLSRSLGERKSIELRVHGASVDMREVAIDAEGVKEIIRITVLVADGGDFLETRGILDGLILIPDKVRDYGERGSHVIDNVQDFAITSRLIDCSVKHDHLAVEVLKRSQPEVAVVE